MIKKIIALWDKNNHELLQHFQTNLKSKDIDDLDYTDLVKLLIKHVLYDMFDDDKLTIIDDGDYQGTQIFILPVNYSYQPSLDNYYFTHNYYGSCSGCDTLENIKMGRDIETQHKELMQLCLHLIQNFKLLTGELE